MSFRYKLKGYTEAPISHMMVEEALSEYNRPNDKISEMIKSGQLQALRRGLYIPGPEMDLPIPDPFVIANHLRGPSYVSLESALYYWALIPERVFEITSVTTKTSKVYTNALGRFSYQHLSTPYYSFGVRSVMVADRQITLMACREKAICDKIVLTSGLLLRSVRQTREFLIEDMRMDIDILQELDLEMIHSWIEDAPKKNSLSILLKTLESL